MPIASVCLLVQVLPHCTATFYPGEGYFSTVENYAQDIFHTLSMQCSSVEGSPKITQWKKGKYKNLSLPLPVRLSEAQHQWLETMMHISSNPAKHSLVARVLLMSEASALAEAPFAFYQCFLSVLVAHPCTHRTGLSHSNKPNKKKEGEKEESFL